MSTDSGSRPFTARNTRTGQEYRYQTDQQLGSGSSGAVYLARRLPSEDDGLADDSRKVALKVVHTSKWKRYLAEEARLLMKLQEAAEVRASSDRSFVHRLVRIGAQGAVLEIDEGVAKAALIELEYLDGQTLQQWLDTDWRHRTDVSGEELLDEVLRIAQELGESLLQLADVGGEDIVHRDIKPDKITPVEKWLSDFLIPREKCGEVGALHPCCSKSSEPTSKQAH